MTNNKYKRDFQHKINAEVEKDIQASQSMEYVDLKKLIDQYMSRIDALDDEVSTITGVGDDVEESFIQLVDNHDDSGEYKSSDVQGFYHNLGTRNLHDYLQSMSNTLNDNFDNLIDDFNWKSQRMNSALDYFLGLADSRYYDKLDILIRQNPDIDFKHIDNYTIVPKKESNGGQKDTKNS